jgi:MYXO-CTERM domain-containing protein
VSHPATPNGHAVTDTTYPPGTPPALEAEVERNREQLAATVDALHHKLDVKAQAKQRVASLRDAATTDSGKPSPAVLGTAALAVAGVGLLLWRRTRR